MQQNRSEKANLIENCTPFETMLGFESACTICCERTVVSCFLLVLLFLKNFSSSFHRQFRRQEHQSLGHVKEVRSSS